MDNENDDDGKKAGKTQQKYRNRHKKIDKCISRSGLAEFGVPQNRAVSRPKSWELEIVATVDYN